MNRVRAMPPQGKSSNIFWGYDQFECSGAESRNLPESRCTYVLSTRYGVRRPRLNEESFRIHSPSLDGAYRKNRACAHLTRLRSSSTAKEIRKRKRPLRQQGCLGCVPDLKPQLCHSVESALRLATHLDRLRKQHVVRRDKHVALISIEHVRVKGVEYSADGALMQDGRRGRCILHHP